MMIVLLLLCLFYREIIHFFVHDCNIQQWKYKVAHGLPPKATSVLFLQNGNMQTWSQSEFLVPQLNTVYSGQNSIRYVGLIIWNSWKFHWLLEMLTLFLNLSSWLKMWSQWAAVIGYAKTMFLILAL